MLQRAVAPAPDYGPETAPDKESLAPEEVAEDNKRVWKETPAKPQRVSTNKKAGKQRSHDLLQAPDMVPSKEL